MGRKKLNTNKRQKFATNTEPRSPRVLIVCEGEKTEPTYFKAICVALELQNVKVIPSTNTAPHQVYQTAKNKQADAEKKRKPYDKIFCVFDDDGHKDFQRISNLMDSDKKIQKICSVPCIEYWFLLHFKSDAVNFTDCQECLKYLQRQFPEYSKEITEEIFKILWAKKDIAKEKAKNADSSSSTSFTEIYLLLEELEKLAK